MFSFEREELEEESFVVLQLLVVGFRRLDLFTSAKCVREIKDSNSNNGQYRQHMPKKEAQSSHHLQPLQLQTQLKHAQQHRLLRQKEKEEKAENRKSERWVES